tara:strand:+ start:21989 stop:22420 length:432 start_codon:yes stop_codon:yes gene_type:complete
MVDSVLTLLNGKMKSKQANLDATGVALSGSFSDGSAPYISTTANAYSTMSHIIWAGTDFLGTINQILMSLSTKDTKNCDFRILDVTNVQVIAEKLAFNSVVVSVEDMGAISNLSSAQADWAIQARKAVTGAEARVSAIIGFSN